MRRGNERENRVSNNRYSFIATLKKACLSLCCCSEIDEEKQRLAQQHSKGITTVTVLSDDDISFPPPPLPTHLDLGR